MSNTRNIKDAVKALPNSNFMWDMATSHKVTSENLDDVDMQWWQQIQSESAEYASGYADYETADFGEAMYG